MKKRERESERVIYFSEHISAGQRNSSVSPLPLQTSPLSPLPISLSLCLPNARDGLITDIVHVHHQAHTHTHTITLKHTYFQNSDTTRSYIIAHTNTTHIHTHSHIPISYSYSFYLCLTHMFRGSIFTFLRFPLWKSRSL